MRVYVNGSSKAIDLTQKDYVGGGGEGNIYVQGSVAYKIYTDPAKMIPLGKIDELSEITDPIVIRPEKIIVDSRNAPVGYTMRFIKHTYTLCQLFPRSFRERNKIDKDIIFDLVQQFQQGVKNVHHAKVLIVDLNEMNFLVGKKTDHIYFIDTDSYQTKHYPATAIMPSIRDWKTKLGKFNENSDWFSFGIVSFQMFTGIHPYKGKHPKVHGLEDRMQAGISVFNKEVSVPSAVYPFSVIPKDYLHWYTAMFEKGERLPPPDKPTPFIIAVAVPVFVPTAIHSSNFNIEEIRDYQSDVIGITGNSKNLVVTTTAGVWWNNHKALDASKAVCGIGFSKGSTPVAITKKDNGNIGLIDLQTSRNIPFDMNYSQISSCDDRAYFKLIDHIYEVVFTGSGNSIVASSRDTASILEHAADLYPGVVIQKLLGASYVSLLSSTGTNQIRIKELDKYKIVDAKFDRGVLMVVGVLHGKYDRLIFRFDSDNSYDLRLVADIVNTGLNFVSLDSGICVSLNEDDELELLSTRKGSSSIKAIKDNFVNGKTVIGDCHDGVFVANGSKVYRVKMKN